MHRDDPSTFSLLSVLEKLGYGDLTPRCLRQHPRRQNVFCEKPRSEHEVHRGIGYAGASVQWEMRFDDGPRSTADRADPEALRLSGNGAVDRLEEPSVPLS